MQTQSHRYVYYKDEDCQLDVEEYQGQVYLHASVHKWSPSVARNCYSILNTLFNELKGMGFDRVYSITPSPKFAAMFGATSLSKFINKNIEYEVVKWDLK